MHGRDARARWHGHPAHASELETRVLWTQGMLQYRPGFRGQWAAPLPRKPDLHGSHALLSRGSGERGVGVETSPPNDQAPAPVPSNLTYG
jgi:hypothetical protein